MDFCVKESVFIGLTLSEVHAHPKIALNVRKQFIYQVVKKTLTGTCKCSITCHSNICIGVFKLEFYTV